MDGASSDRNRTERAEAADQTQRAEAADRTGDSSRTGAADRRAVPEPATDLDEPTLGAVLGRICLALVVVAAVPLGVYIFGLLPGAVLLGLLVLALAVGLAWLFDVSATSETAASRSPSDAPSATDSGAGGEHSPVVHVDAGAPEASDDRFDIWVGPGPHGETIGDVPPGEQGWLGNPYARLDHDAQTARERFRVALERRLRDDGDFRAAVRELADRRLGCPCPYAGEEPCHAAVVAAVAARLDGAPTDDVSIEVPLDVLVDPPTDVVVSADGWERASESDADERDGGVDPVRLFVGLLVAVGVVLAAVGWVWVL